MLKIGSLFSGVGGLELGLLNTGKFDLTYVADPDKWCSQVLAYHRPGVPNLGTVTKTNSADIPYADIIMGGTSCQNFSYQGDRKGLEGKKSKLFYDFIRIVRDKQPKYVLWENVAGALTANKKSDFNIIKDLFNEAGYEIDYDLFNSAEYCGTVQQRKRIILLATRKDLNQVRLNRTIPDIQLNEEMQSIKRAVVGVSKSHRHGHIDFRLNEGMANTLVTGWGCSGMSTKNYINNNGVLEDLSINVCELLMTWPKDHTKYGIDGEIPMTQRYKMCGNGAVSELISHLLRDLYVHL